MAGEKHANIALFVNHVGCPLQCTFCNQNVIVGETAQGAGPQTCTPDDVRNAILTAEAHGTTGAQLAFFGGSFTGIDRDYMVSLLEAVQPYIGTVVTGIRCSTRPDYIDDEVLDLLKTYHVEAIELGAQSMDDRVLALNKRGHTADDVRQASRLIRARGFELGLQMMTGLYGDTDDGALRTADELIALAPATVRMRVPPRLSRTLRKPDLPRPRPRGARRHTGRTAPLGARFTGGHQNRQPPRRALRDLEDGRAEEGESQRVKETWL